MIILFCQKLASKLSYFDKNDLANHLILTSLERKLPQIT